jgi:hypothetical protein
MQFYDRRDLTIFTLSLAGKNTAARLAAAVEQLRPLYPVPVTAGQILIRKNRNAHNWIVAVFRSGTDVPQGMLSTWYILDRLPSFTGTVLLRERTFTEICRLHKGTLLESTCTDTDTGAAEMYGSAHAAGAVFLHSGIFPSYDRSPENKYVFELPDTLRTMTGRKIGGYALALLLLSAALMCTAYNYRRIRNEKKVRLAAQAAVRIKKEAAEKEQKKTELCAALYKTYSALYAQTPVEPYAACSLIYDCLDQTTTVTSLSLSEQTFQADLYGSDAVRVLRNFERQPGLTSCTINRVAVEKDTGRQVYIVSGTVLHTLPDTADTDTGRRIAFYETKTAGLERYRNTCSAMTLSQAVLNIRTLMRSAGCSEEYIQRQTDGGTVELDVSMKGTGTAVFSFLKQCAGKIALTSLRIKNYPDRNTVSALVRVATYIPEKAENVTARTAENLPDVTPSALSTAFSRPHVAAAKTAAAPEPTHSTPERAEKASWLTYLGAGRTSDGTQCIFLKNTRTGDITKITNFTETGGMLSFTAGDGKKYEVTR